MALHSKKCIVTSSNVFKRMCGIEKIRQRNKIKNYQVCVESSSPINIHSTFNMTTSSNKQGCCSIE